MTAFAGTHFVRCECRVQLLRPEGTFASKPTQGLKTPGAYWVLTPRLEPLATQPLRNGNDQLYSKKSGEW